MTMTPIQAAVKAARDRDLIYADGKNEGPLSADDARAIITAFLDAAAGDARVLSNVLEAIDYELHVAESGEEFGDALGLTVLHALKEAVNG